MVNWSNIFNQEWFQKVTALQKEWYDFCNHNNSFQRLFNILNNFLGPTRKESAASNGSRYPGFAGMANLLNILSSPFFQTEMPKINHFVQRSVSTPANLLFGTLPSLIWRFSNFFF